MSIAPLPASVRADITCYDFTSQSEAQAVFDALPGDPYEIDSGWPPPGIAGGGDQEAGNGVPCDAENDIPELESPGDETYAIGADPTHNGLDQLPGVELEQATIREVQYAGAVQTEENPEKLFDIMGIATPEYELFADYEDREVPGQCGADAATARLQELLAPGTTVWLEIDEAGFFTQTVLDRHVWIELDGRYRLISEVLVSEGHAVVATERPGTGRGDASENPPPGARYRDALREAQERAINERAGMWGQCGA
jgi:endonuclease YncB( thermonuclease family)